MIVHGELRDCVLLGPVTCSMTELEMLALEDDDDGR